MPAEHYTAEFFNERIAEKGYVADIGQIGPELKKRINRAIRAGTVVKYRGYWDTGHACFGMGPLKSCYTSAEVYSLPENDWFFGRPTSSAKAA